MSDKHDKTFDPTPQRIRKAREEGNVFKAQEMSSVMSLIVGFSVLILGMPYAFKGLQMLARRVFLRATTTPLTPTSVPHLLMQLGLQVLGILAPFMVALVVTGVSMSLIQSGWNVTTQPLIPKPDKISPLKGLKRIFSARGMFMTAKSVLKIFIVGPIAYLNIKSHLPEILVLHTMPVSSILEVAASWIILLLFQLLLVLLILSALDFAFEKWKYKEDLKMSKQEVKDEMKESEGDPQVRVRRRRLAQDIARRPRLDHAVLNSDFVVTNPTHYAVGLRYDPESAGAPIVMIKGIRKRALRIKELAKELGIPTIEDRPLARALYNTVEESTEIPADLYPAVAAILAELYRSKGTYGKT